MQECRTGLGRAILSAVELTLWSEGAQSAGTAVKVEIPGATEERPVTDESTAQDRSGVGKM